MHRTTRLASVVGGVTLALALGTSTVLAHHCTPASKASGAGSIGTYNVVTEAFTPAKRLNGTASNGGFITFTDGTTFSYDVFMHQTLPEGAFAAGPGGDDQCDGRGVDDALDCLGIPH